MRSESPPVNRENANRDARSPTGNGSEDADLRAVQVKHIGTNASRQPVQLEDTEGVLERVQSATDVDQRDEPCPCARRSVSKRPGSMRGNRDVEVLGECRQQMCYVTLRTSGLREGYRDEQARLAAGRNDALLRDWGCHNSAG
jgi:hypothetical protein